MERIERCETAANVISEPPMDQKFDGMAYHHALKSSLINNNTKINHLIEKLDKYKKIAFKVKRSKEIDDLLKSNSNKYK